MIVKLIPWALVLILGIIVGTLFHSNVSQEIEISNLHIDNKIKEKQILERDSIIKVNNIYIDSLDVIQDRVAESISKLLNNDGKIQDKYKDLYLNPDSSDWNKLDSLASIILHR